MLKTADVSLTEVLAFFSTRGIEVAFLVPTETGMAKSIMDATSSVREFLKLAGIHDFETQPQGQEHKKLVPAEIVTAAGLYRTEVSLYRPVTKKGDPRIWIRGLGNHARAGNVLALVAKGDGTLLVINASNAGMVAGVQYPTQPFLLVRDGPNLDAILAPLILRISEPANELLALMMERLGGRWHEGRPGLKRDLEVGRLLEELLGIKANSKRTPDYKGIEIKASRKGGGNRQTLFAKVPDWSISPLKSSGEILDVFGYQRGTKYQRQLRCTVSAKAPNSQGLFLSLEDGRGRLLEASELPAVRKVAYWPIASLQDALRTKHPATFWVSAANRRSPEGEAFRYESVVHTRQPLLSALPTLLEVGVVTVDHLISRDLKGKVEEKGPLFKIKKIDLNLLFPPGELHVLHK